MTYRYPIEPLLRAAGVAPSAPNLFVALGQACGISSNTVQVALTRGGNTLNAVQADSWASGLGVGPEGVWSEWSEQEPIGGVCRCPYGPFVDPYAEDDDDIVCDRCGREYGDRAPSAATLRDREWYELERRGLSASQIAERAGVHRNTVHTALARVRPPKPNVSAEATIKALRAEGVPTMEIARRTRRSRQAVRMYVGGTRAATTPLTDVERQTILDMWEGGHTCMSIAQRIGRSASAVRELVKPGKPKPTGPERQQARDMAASGMSIAAIAKATGRDWGTVRRMVPRDPELSDSASGPA